jgi:hypothetical protein
MVAMQGIELITLLTVIYLNNFNTSEKYRHKYRRTSFAAPSRLLFKGRSRWH